MRKLLFILVLFISANLMYSQTATIRLGDFDVTGLVPGDKVYVPIYVDAISSPGDIITMQMFFAYDHSVLTWDGTFANPLNGVQNFHPNFPYGTPNGSWLFNDNGEVLGCLWDDAAGAHIMPAGGMFFEYKFTYHGGETTLQWSPDLTELNDGNFNLYELTFVDGCACFANFDITFHVTESGNNLEGADVTVGAQTITTDVNGNAVFSLPNGNYSYLVTKAGYYNKTGNFTVSGSNQTINVPMNLLGSEFDVTFQVTSGGNPVEGATVIAGGETVITNALGEGVVSLPNGDFNYTVTKYGYTDESGTFTVNGAPLTIPVSLTMLPHYDVLFYVTTEGNNLEGALIDISGVGTMMTNSSGEATFSLIDGDYNYQVSKTGFTTETGSFTVAGSAFTINISMIQLFGVTFHVTSDGNNLPGALVTIGSESHITDANGMAIFNLANGSYSYSITKDGYNEESGSFSVAGASQTIEVTMTLETWEVTFHVTSGGIDVEGALVTIDTESILTNASGIAIFNLPNGEYTYLITKAGYYDVIDVLQVNNNAMTIAVEMNLVPVYYDITFHVTSGGNNLDLALITIGSESLLTNSEGIAVFALLNGPYDYTITKSGYTTVTGSFTVNNGPQTIEVSMSVITYPTTFIVQDQNNQPVQGAVVTVTGFAPQTTPANGTVVFDLPNGTYPWTVTKTGYVTANGNVVVNNSPQTVNVALNLITFATTFIVKDQNNQPVQGAIVTVTGFTPLTTPANGTVVFDLPNGTFPWSVTKTGYTTANGNVTVNNAPQTINVTLNQITYATTFVVKDQNNQAVQGAVVTVTGYAPQTTPANGTVVFNLPNGTFPWTVTKTGYTTASGNVVVNNAPQTVNVTLPLITYATTFVIKDQGNQPLQGAVVTVTGYPPQTTPANGTVVFQLPNGTYSFTVVKDLYQTYTDQVVVNNAAQTVNVNMTLIGIEDITINNFNVYPNPSQGTFNLTTSAIVSYESNITVYDLAGKLVYTSKLQGNDINVIDLSTQEKGMYLLQIVVEDKVYNKTLVIQ
jgi:uncharacterized membrane protein